MPLIDWVASLSFAQRDAIRTIALVVGSGCVPVFGFILTWLLRIVRRQTKQTVQQTRTEDYVNGKLVPSTLGEMVRRTMHNTEEIKAADITGLIRDVRTAPIARRGLPSAELSQSRYRGETNE